MSRFLFEFRRLRADYVGIFALVFLAAAYVQFQPVIGDPDGFYHAKMAVFLQHGIVLRTMPWMQFSSLRDSFTDHHFLYHVALVPFVAFGKPLLGVKLATVAFTTSFFTAFYWTLKRLSGLAPLFFTAVLLICSSFLFRLSLVKANSLSLIVFLLILVAVLEYRPLLLGLLSAAYIWLYGGWVLAWVVVAAALCARYAHRFIHRTRRAQEHAVQHRPPLRRSWILVGASIAGSLAGMILNPYWPDNFSFYLQQVWQIAILNQSPVAVGGEWSGLSWYEIANELSWVMVLGMIALTLFLVRFKHMSVRSLATGVLALLFFIFNLKSRRYIELSAPGIVLWASFVGADVFSQEIRKKMAAAIRHALGPARRAWYALWISAGVAFVILPSFGAAARIQEVRSEIGQGIPLTKYEQASRWLSSRTEPGNTVLHSDWDDWPILFFHNTYNYYIIGLDPTFMYNFNPALYQKWAALTGEGRADTLGTLVTAELSSKYVLIEKDHQAMQKLFLSNVFFRLVYEDDEVWIYQAIPAQQT